MLRPGLQPWLLRAVLVAGLVLGGVAAGPTDLATYSIGLPRPAPSASELASTGPWVPQRLAVELLAAENQKAASTGRPTGDGGATASQASRGARSARSANLNGYVLTAIKTYQGGSYPYLLNDDYAHYNGVTADIYYQGSLLLRADPTGSRASHCVGITFEVFYRAMQARNRAAGLDVSSFNGMSFAQLQDFVLRWYAASGSKAESNPAAAIVKYGLGQQVVTWETAQPGDFVDFSRTNGTGHSVIFLNWIRRDGVIVGLRYWSSQGSTGGIGYREEYFSLPNGAAGGLVLTSDFYIGRVGPVNSYR